jgi:hypothetical protein
MGDGGSSTSHDAVAMGRAQGLEEAAKLCDHEAAIGTTYETYPLLAYREGCSDCAHFIRKAALSTPDGQAAPTPANSMTIDDFYKFARRIAKRDKWFIGGFLGEVWKEWNEKNKRVG